MSVDKDPVSGLWAWSQQRFYALDLQPGDRTTDHVRWFQELGLPDYGKAYDAILRGRMTWDWHFKHYVLSFYGIKQLPNQVYDLVERRFNPSGLKVVEKSISNYWV